MKEYKPKQNSITAMQLEGELIYIKWGGEQTGKVGDWIVNKDGNVYTIDNESFRLTYEHQHDNVYSKTAHIWAEKAEAEGKVKTKEGYSEYKEGDMIVSNTEDGSDSYCMTEDKFDSLYERV